MNLFDFRWNVLAGRQIGLYDDSFGHFELPLRDILADVLAATPFKKEKKLAGHRNVVDTVATVIHGSHFSRLAIKNEGKEGIGNGAVGVLQHQVRRPRRVLLRGTWGVLPSSRHRRPLSGT